jgi:hypothetical protein
MSTPKIIPPEMGEGCGCAAMILAAGLFIFLVFVGLQASEIVDLLTK